MSPHCGRLFTLVRRRHHCRKCGEVFCKSCAPRPKSTGQLRQRTCLRCTAGIPQGQAPEHLAATATSGSPPPPAAAAAGAADWLIECQIESTLWAIRWWSAVLTIGVALLAASVLRTQLAFVEPSRLRAPLGVVALTGFLLRSWLRRYAHVAWVCLVLGVNVLLTKRRVQGRSGTAQDAVWEMAHRLNARFVFDAVVQLGGFWVKLAQSASVLSVLPEAYSLELAKLQDAMPADPLWEVEALLAQELGKDWAGRLRLHPGPPLGSATIAQVHRATLRVPGGERGELREVEGVVKIQHPHVEGRLKIDIYASTLIAHLLTALLPHLFSDFTTVVKDAATITQAELDFTAEAENQSTACASLRESGLDVIVPEVYPSFVTRRVLGMQFIDGVKVTELTGAAASPEERKRVVASLLDYYGFTLHGPVFNFDPHPGNLLVERGTGRLCVLDWGQARHLSLGQRLSFARIFMAALSEDFTLFYEACTSLGFALKGQDPSKDSPDSTAVTMCSGLRFIFRDSRPMAQSKEDFSVLESNFARLSGELKAIQSGGEEILKGPLMPISKTCLLLFEVSGILGVSLPLMHVIAGHGYRLLLRESGYGAASVHSTGKNYILQLGPPPSRPLAAGVGRLQATCDGLLRKLHGEGAILGAQLVVLDTATGASLADVALGHCSWLRPDPVEASTPFNIEALSKLFLAFAVLRLVDRGSLSLHTALSGTAASPGRRPRGGAGRAADAPPVTLEHALAHTAGLFESIPGFVKHMLELFDLDLMMDRISGARPLLAPGARQQYHHLTYGWLLALACRTSGTDLDSAWSDFLGAALAGRRDALKLRAPAGAVADLCKHFHSPSIEDMAKGMERFSFLISVIDNGKKVDATPAERADGATWLSHFGKELWCNGPAMAREPWRSAALPGVQAYATASAAAEALRAVAAGEVLRPELLAEALRSRRPPQGSHEARPCRLLPDKRMFDNGEWGLGIQLDPLRNGSASSGSEPASAPRSWGHVASNGSFALALPGRQPMVAVLLLNRDDGEHVARQVLDMLLQAAA